MGNITFGRAENIIHHEDFAAWISGDINDKDVLFQKLAEGLQFPDYFGKNWDAVSDCLRDFHWRNERRIVLVHADLPKLVLSDMRKYLEILSDAIDDWRRTGDRELLAVFPSDTKQAVADILRNK